MKTAELSTVARSALYLVCAGGLLAFFSVLVWLSWNSLSHLSPTFGELQPLEAIGVASIFYLFVSAYGYGRKSSISITTLHNVNHQAIRREVNSEISRSIANDKCKDMSAEERDRLKAELGKCCGLGNCERQSDLEVQNTESKLKETTA